MVYTSAFPPAQSTTYVKATESQPTGYDPRFATTPGTDLTGTYNRGNSWITNSATTNMRFHIDLGSAVIVSRIYYENLSQNGGTTNAGLKNFTFWGSNDATAFSTLTYGTDTNWTQLTTDIGQFAQHVALDQADPKYVLVTNSTAYRYYAIKIADNWGNASFMGVRRIELQNDKLTLGEYLGAGNGITQALYHFNNNSMNDSSGNGNNGVGTSITYVDGKFGKGANFGAGSHIILPNSASLNITSGNITVVAWIKMTATGAEYFIVSKSGNTAGNIQYTMNVGVNLDAQFRVCSNYTGPQNAITGHNSIPSGQRCCLIGTYSSAENINRIYVNGVLKGQANSNGWGSYAGAAEIGIRTADGYGQFYGQIDEVFIENVLWSDSQIKKYCTMTKGRFGIL